MERIGNNRGKKGQSALEFISNYGWAILIIIILGVLMTFYMFRADMFGTDQCVLKAGFGCKEFEFTQKYIKVNVINSLGKNLAAGITANIICNGHHRWNFESPYNGEVDSFNLPVKNGANFTLLFPPLNKLDTRGSCRLTINYTEDRYGAYPKSATGTLRWKQITTEGVRPTEDCGWTGDDDFDSCTDDTDSECGHKEIEISVANVCFNGKDDDCGQGIDCEDNQSVWNPVNPDYLDCCRAYAPCSDNTFNNLRGEYLCTCTNGVYDSNFETDVDCGNRCRINLVGEDYKCDWGESCTSDDDCKTTMECNAGVCTYIPLCDNNILNPGESDIKNPPGTYSFFNSPGGATDCGSPGSGCAICATSRHCYYDSDCVGGYCCKCATRPNLNMCGSSSPIIFKGTTCPDSVPQPCPPP
jgi:hypothetical protein